IRNAAQFAEQGARTLVLIVAAARQFRKLGLSLTAIHAVEQVFGSMDRGQSKRGYNLLGSSFRLLHQFVPFLSSAELLLDLIERCHRKMFQHTRLEHVVNLLL